VLLRVSAFAALGTAPAATAGFRAGAGWRREWFALSAEFVDQLRLLARSTAVGAPRRHC